MVDRLEFSFQAHIENERQERFASEMASRFDVLRGMATQHLATRAFEIIQGKLPTSKRFEDLRNDLVIRDIDGLDAKEHGTAISFTTVAKRRVSGFDKDTTILIVREPTRKTSEDDRDILTAIAGQWTVDTIPVLPKSSRTYVRAIRKPKPAVDRIRSVIQREKLPGVMKELRSVFGAGFSRVANQREIMGAFVSTSPGNTGLFSLRTEFGIDGEEFSPHWRPALRHIKSVGFKEFVTRRDVLLTMLDVDYTDWRRFRPLKTISTKRAESFVDFQKKVDVQ